MRPGLFSAVALSALALSAIDLAAQPQRNPNRARAGEEMRFQGMDRNGDGRITRQEWRGSVQSFRRHDWNGDGILSGDEVRPGAQRRRSDDDYDVNRGREVRDWSEEAFAELDHNRDGRITRDEWHFDREAWLRADRNRDNVLTRVEFLGDQVDLDREDRFEYLDVNDNNRIERREWHGSDEGFTWLDRNGDGVLSRVEMLGDEPDPVESDLFASLDYNHDGRLSPDEWHWSRRSFLRQDANRDGVLSPSEFSAPAEATAGPTGTSGRFRADEHEVVVDARERWVDTGIDLRVGDRVSIRTEGTVRLSAGWNDTAEAAGATRRAPNAPLPSEPAGALIARVGSGPPIFIGDNSVERNVTAGGRLYLSVNDDHLADNSGQFRVTVSFHR